MKPLFVKKNTTTATASGFSSTDWPSRMEDERIDLAKLAGDMLEERKGKFGPSSMDNPFKGMLNLAHAIGTGELKTGALAAKDLFDNRLIVSMDPGQTNFVGSTMIFGKLDEHGVFQGEFVKKNVKTECTYIQNLILITLSVLFLYWLERLERRAE